MMQDYRIAVRLRSPVGTPWHSDTIFGHLCWQVSFGAIEMEIDDFLAPFKAGNPPFILSDAFPSGLLPRPLVPSRSIKVDSVEEYAQLKRLKKAPYVTASDFLHLCRGEEMKDMPQDDPWQPIATLHASLGRNTMTTGDDGQLYSVESRYLEGGMLEIYARCQPDWVERLEKLFRSMARGGYGKDKSVGLGAFEFVNLSEFGDFRGVEDANGFISLSSMVPAKDDPADARFRLRAKYGKLGEGASPNPFKRPLLQMEAGAFFRTTGDIRDFYGRLVEDIAPGMPEAVQNCYALSVPCTIRN
jgi:CRISPR-associated protein Csm4